MQKNFCVKQKGALRPRLLDAALRRAVALNTAVETAIVGVCMIVGIFI